VSGNPDWNDYEEIIQSHAGWAGGRAPNRQALGGTHARHGLQAIRNEWLRVRGTGTPGRIDQPATANLVRSGVRSQSPLRYAVDREFGASTLSIYNRFMGFDYYKHGTGPRVDQIAYVVIPGGRG
jgi:hypothetical protein